MCKSKYRVKLLKKGNTPSFKHATWERTVKNRSLMITGVYHPPHSTRNKITNKMFIDDFTEFSTSLLSEHNNNILLGDFNLHVSDETNTDAAIFTDTCEAMGLYQYITFPTHKSGNILDLILTEISSNMKVLHAHRGPFISDHTLVLAQLNIKQQSTPRQTEMVHAIKDITTEQWTNAFEDQDLQLSDDFHEMVMGLNSALRTKLDKLAPEKKVCKSLRPKCPWYTAKIRQLRRKVSKLEKKWLKYKLDSCWMAYKKARNSYYAKLNLNKKMTLKDKIAGCANDSKSLHNLVNNLNTKSVDNPLPKANLDEELAYMFADFFED